MSNHRQVKACSLAQDILQFKREVGTMVKETSPLLYADIKINVVGGVVMFIVYVTHNLSTITELCAVGNCVERAKEALAEKLNEYPEMVKKGKLRNIGPVERYELAAFHKTA